MLAILSLTYSMVKEMIMIKVMETIVSLGLKPQHFVTLINKGVLWV